jgi:hypothetical protein
MELVIHPVLYEGVRKASGEIGRLWAPAPMELARIDHIRQPHALALGLILPDPLALGAFGGDRLPDPHGRQAHGGRWHRGA